MNPLETSKNNVVAFYDLMFNQCEPREAVKRFVGAEYIQHNPHVESGKQGFIAYFEKMAIEYPGKRSNSNAPLPKATTWFCIAIKYGPAAVNMPESISFASTKAARL